MESQPVCPHCGAEHTDVATCQDDFYQMLFWESEDPARGVVHHLMVMCYHLQHPHLYSPDGLRHLLGLLVRFVANGASTQEVRRETRGEVDSGTRTWKVTARPGHEGAYAKAPAWTMRAADVVAGGAEAYVENVRVWAQSVYEALRASGNLNVQG
jgi:hypothetical protein